MKHLCLLWVSGIALWSLAGVGRPNIPEKNPSPISVSVLTMEEHILWHIPIAVHRLGEKEWQVFPGIGPAISHKLVGKRTLEELDATPGIGPKILTAIKPFLSFF